MKKYSVERIQGQAGYEKTLWAMSIEAESIEEVLADFRPNGDYRGWTEYSREDFASLSNPNTGERYDDSLIIEENA